MDIADGRMPQQQEEFGQCPKCGGPIIEGKRGFGCSRWKPEDGGCRFVIWKTISGKETPPQIVRQLLSEKQTDLIEGFVSKAQKPFSAKLKLVQEFNDWKVMFDFQNDNTEVLGKCPACGGNIVETKKAYGCANWREQDGGCKFVIWKTMAQKEISAKIATQLIETGSSDILLGFISKKGSPFSARLKLGADESGIYKVVFDFENGPKSS